MTAPNAAVRGFYVQVKRDDLASPPDRINAAGDHVVAHGRSAGKHAGD